MDRADDHPIPPRSGHPGRGLAPWPVRIALFVAACASVFPLLAWVYGLGSFRAWALASGPLVIGVVATAVWLDRTGRWPATRAALLAGALGGLVGSLAYDLFRVPFVYLTGLQLLAPIESYGVLLLGADTSSPLTDFAGWAYHFTNGMGFGVAWAVIATGRRWIWGVGWGLFLETMTIVSPFAGTYGLIANGQVQWTAIGLAYAAHVPYGAAVGLFAQHAVARAAELRGLVRAPAALAIAVLLAALIAWHRPLLPQAEVDRGIQVAPGPSAIVLEGKLRPAWLRVPVGGCSTVENGDAADHRLSTGQVLAASGGRATVCGQRAGIQRVRVDDGPFSGGWLLVDPAP